MIIKIQVDEEKANALIKMARISLERLNEFNIEKYPSNTLIDYYDIFHKLLEAVSLKLGFKIKGEFAHKELINFVSKEFNFEEEIRLFLQKMRLLRNRISYEGFLVNKNFIILNKSLIKRILNILFIINSLEL